MKILAVTNMFPTEKDPSWGSFVSSQVTSLQAAGHHVDVIHIKGDTSKKAYLTAIGQVRRAARKTNYDVVHAHYGLSAFPCLLGTRTPLVISYCGSDVFGHTDENGKTKLVSGILAWFQRQAGRFASGIIVKSSEMVALLPRAAQAKTTVVPNGVSFDVFHPGDREKIRKSMGLDPKTFYVLFPYSPDRPRKNYALLEHAISALQADGCAIEPYVMHGKPPSVLSDAMRAVDCLALTSFWEGSPNAVKEAMASNLPLLATDVGDIRWLVGDAEGCELSSLDSVEFTEKLRKLYDRGTKQSNGREVIDHLRIERVADQLTDLYEQVLEM